ncbi:DsbA family protein [Sphingomonas sp. RHCKR47]|uniref:thioredoxin domain-containing protein n=1 Tax=Sphingomonas citricola TaxID=2862498 RepID=UPI001C6736CA|nr:thioredoxin domain-containing protein [Sphingomonas citricola]MBW6524487.1 DsbA family protein [Sphingomonas citricola]
MKTILPLIAAALFAASPTAAAPRAWTSVAAPVATGSYLIGNPKARVRLVEILSYTCPHCAHFAAKSDASIKAMVRSGTLAIELRNQLHDKIDLAAATLARCAGPAAFPAVHAAFLARQREWIDRAIEWDQANGARVATYPQAAQLRALADGAGLTAIAREAGVTPAAIEACFANENAMNATLKVSQSTEAAAGTPAFIVNGKMIQTVTWAQLQPMLRAAGAR